MDSLIIAFIDRERQDFGDRYGPEWTEKRVEELERRLPELTAKLGAEELVFESIGNTGVTLRKLSIEPPSALAAYNGSGPKVEVVFCNCGKDDHAFFITLRNREGVPVDSEGVPYPPLPDSDDDIDYIE